MLRHREPPTVNVQAGGQVDGKNIARFVNDDDDQQVAEAIRDALSGAMNASEKPGALIRDLYRNLYRPPDAKLGGGLSEELCTAPPL